MAGPEAAPGARPPSHVSSPRGTPRAAAPVAIIDWAALAHVIVRPSDTNCPDSRGLPKRAVKSGSKMLPLMLEAAPSSRGLTMRSPRVTLVAQAAQADGWPVHLKAAGGTPGAERECRNVPVQLAASAEGDAVAETPADAGSTFQGSGRDALGWPDHKAGLLGPRPAAPMPADSGRRRRLHAATTLLSPHMWAAASALRPSSAARPTTPAWCAAVAEAAERQTLRPGFSFPVVECGEVVRDTRGAFAGQRYRRYRCSVCAAHNAAAGRAPEMIRPPRRPIWIEVPVHSGEGGLSSRPGPFIARRADLFEAHAHENSAHAVFAGAMCHCADVGEALRAVEAAAERLETVVVQPNYASTHPSTQPPIRPPPHPPAHARGRSMRSPVGHLSAAQWEAPWGETCGADTVAVPRLAHVLSPASAEMGTGLSPRNHKRPVSPSYRGQKPGGEADAGALAGVTHTLSTAASARRAIHEPRASSLRGDRLSRSQGKRPAPKDAAPSPRAHLSYVGATGADSESESEPFRPPTPPSCTAPIAASRRRALAYEVALCH